MDEEVRHRDFVMRSHPVDLHVRRADMLVPDSMAVRHHSDKAVAQLQCTYSHSAPPKNVVGTVFV